MRVAVLNRGRDAYPGGDLVHIDELSRALARIGVERVYEDGPTLGEGYDLIHVHHINFSWSRMNFAAVRRHPGVPYVVTTIFYPTENLGVSFKEMEEVLVEAAAVVTYSRTEEREVRQYTHLVRSVFPVPPGVSCAFHSYEWKREGVLVVTARSGAKGCEMVREACEALNIPFKMAIGVSREELPQWYAEARVFVNASDHEAFGLTILEGLAAGCRVLATRESWGLEWFPGIMQIDPQEGLKEAIEFAYHSLWWNWTPNVKARIMTWDEEAAEVKRIYEGALEGIR